MYEMNTAQEDDWLATILWHQLKWQGAPHKARSVREAYTAAPMVWLA